MSSKPQTAESANLDRLVVGDDPKVVRKIRMTGLLLFNAGAFLAFVFLRNFFVDPWKSSWLLVAAFVIIVGAFLAGSLSLILSSSHRATFDRGTGMISIERSSITGQHVYEGALREIESVGVQQRIGRGGKKITRPVLYLRDGTEINVIGTTNDGAIIEARAGEIANFLGVPMLPARFTDGTMTLNPSG